MEKEGSTHRKEIEREKNEAKEKKIYTFMQDKETLPSSTSFTLILKPLSVTKASDLNCTFAHVPTPEVQCTMATGKFVGYSLQRYSDNHHWLVVFITRNLQERRS